MRFVLFNVAVIAALFFLFDSDRAGLTALADKAYAAIGAERTAEKSTVAAAPTPIVAGQAKTAQPPAPKPAKAQPKPADNPVPKRVNAENADKAVAKVTTPALVEKKQGALDPAVAKRRAEVLGLAPIASEGTAFQTEEKLMTADQRRRELFTLAEEMELFYVRRLNR